MNKHQTVLTKEKNSGPAAGSQPEIGKSQDAFASLARLACFSCKVPVALIVTFEGGQHSVLSVSGIDAGRFQFPGPFPVPRYPELVLEVEDTLEHPQFRELSFVSHDPQIRFYAGAALYEPGGNCLGCLSVMDTRPRKLDGEQTQALKTLAASVLSELMLASRTDELTEIRSRDKDFSTLFNATSDIRCVLDKSFRIEIINKAVFTILGHGPGHLIGKNFWNLFSRGISMTAKKQVLSGFDSGKHSSEIRTPMVTGSGEIKWLNWELNFKENKWYVAGRDVTDHQHVERDREILSLAARKSPSGLIIRDREGRIQWMNEAQELLLGYTLDEMRGRDFDELLIRDQRTGKEGEAIALNGGQRYEVEVRLFRKDGNPVWVLLSNTPLLDDFGKIDRQVAVMVDISARRMAEEQHAMLSMVASSITSGVVINDRDGNVEWVNKAFEQITGYTLADTRGRLLGDLLRGELTDMAAIRKSRELSREKQSFEMDLLVYRKNGQPLWLSVINSVILDDNGKVEKYIEVLIDITAKKKIEAELIAAREEALQLSRAKDMFISVMSHEIRNPLNAVIGMSHLLLEDDAEELRKENLGILRFSAENLMTLINNVLDFTKIETGNIELERAGVDLRELVQSIASSMQFSAAEKKIFIRHEIDDAVPSTVTGDPTRLCQILLNLVGNAVKFTEAGGITISVRLVHRRGRQVSIRFSVADTGIGIASDKKNTIFESFKQAESDTSRKYGGTGLGLAITKKLVELHGSEIHVDSQAGSGSTFWFIINFETDQFEPVINHDTVETDLQLNVLVVDDNQINRLLINKVLGKWGANTEYAENGQEAIEKIEANANLDVVLMDIHMPVMGGLEATRIIRARDEAYFRQLPIIALTASMLSSEVNEIEQAGMNDYILKPFDPKGLYDKLSKYQKVQR